MQRWRHSHDQISHPAIVSVTRRSPLTAFKLSCDHIRFLLRWTLNEEEPRIEAPCVERRCHPAADVREIISVEIQLVMLQQRRPRHSSRLEIVEQGSSLALRQCLAAARDEYA